MEIKYLVISTRTIVKVILVGLALILAFLTANILALLFVAFIIAIALEPFVNFLSARRVPRTMAVVFCVLLFFSTLISLSVFALSPFVAEFSNLATRWPVYLDNFLHIKGMENINKQIIEGLTGQLSSISSNIFKYTINIFNTLLSLVLVLAFCTYILLDIANLRTLFVKSFPRQDRKKIYKTVRRIEVKLGAWLRGQIFLMLIIGSFTFIGLYILGIDYVFALAVIAGILEAVPIIGPIVAVVPAAIIGFSISPAMGFAVIGLYLIIQQLENNLLVPKVMEKAVGQSPILTILALMIGGRLFGILGAILAIPICIIIIEVIKYFRNE